MVKLQEKNAIKAEWIKSGGVLRLGDVLELPLRNEASYKDAVDMMDSILDEVGADEAHPLNGLLEILGIFIEEYERKNYAIDTSDLTPGELLKSLMDEHGLQQTDLKPIIGQSAVSEVIHGKRKLTVDQITQLAKCFNISPLCFLESGTSSK